MATSSNLPTNEATVQPSTPREQKTLSIRLPADLAAKAEALAERQGRAISDLFAEAFRDYYGGVVDSWFEELSQLGSSRNPHGYNEEDIPRLIKEVRAEMAAEERTSPSAKAS